MSMSVFDLSLDDCDGRVLMARDGAGKGGCGDFLFKLRNSELTKSYRALRTSAVNRYQCQLSEEKVMDKHFLPPSSIMSDKGATIGAGLLEVLCCASPRPLGLLA